MTYAVKHNSVPVTQTDWSPMAQAAWHRATRDQATGGIVELLKNGRVIATHRIVGGRGADWPDGPACGLRDVVKALMQLLRDDDWDAKQVADAMSKQGLPTSRARVEAMKGSAGRSVDLSHAEVVTLINAVLSEYKSNGR